MSQILEVTGQVPSSAGVIYVTTHDDRTVSLGATGQHTNYVLTVGSAHQLATALLDAIDACEASHPFSE